MEIVHWAAKKELSELEVHQYCSMKLKHGARGALLALLLSLLLSTCTTQESEESLELQEENNTVSTESPVSQIRYTHLLFTCQGFKAVHTKTP